MVWLGQRFVSGCLLKFVFRSVNVLPLTYLPAFLLLVLLPPPLLLLLGLGNLLLSNVVGEGDRVRARRLYLAEGEHVARRGGGAIIKTVYYHLCGGKGVSGRRGERQDGGGIGGLKKEWVTAP